MVQSDHIYVRKRFLYALGPLKCEGHPYLLSLLLTDDIYLTFLHGTLPELLEVVPLKVPREMWFQHNGAPAHCTNVVREYLDETLVTEGLYVDA
jgi:hypothetical protein